MTTYSFTVPVRTVSEMNNAGRGHWILRHKRFSAQKDAVTKCCDAYLFRDAIKLPCVVRLTRISAGTLDDDGLRSALKAVRDAIAKWLGVDDGKTELVRYQYDQEPGKRKEYGVRVTVIPGARLEERVVVG